MSFFLEKAIFVNRSPFEKLELDFKEKGISVLTAVNGKGKTTILSYIADAFYELAKTHYTKEFEGKETKYYRLSSSSYNIDQEKPSFVYFRFINNGNNIDYIDVRNSCQQKDYDLSITIENKIPFDKIRSQLNRANNIKYWDIAQDTTNSIVPSIFEKNIVTYFPSYRYEVPSYLNEDYQIKTNYKLKGGFVGSLPNPIEVVSGIRQLANWILDVVLDWEIYKRSEKRKDSNGVEQTIDTSPELNIWRNLNEIIRQTLSSKHYVGTVRLGIGKRNDAGTRISIVEDNQEHLTTVSPNLFCLSSGELAMLCCFGELLRQADEIQPNIIIGNIQGIVLIDEVDKHLHIKLQKEVLPRMFKLFPNVQFIVSSHSPFMNMGLAEEAIGRTQIFDLDNNGIVCEPTSIDIYKEVYQMMLNENNRFYSQYQRIRVELNKLNKPIILTEGKTDLTHILKAKEKLNIKIDFETINPDNQPDGDSNLQKMLNQLSKVKHSNKIIAVFDRDVSKTVQIMDGNGLGYKLYGNNVYGFCISAPQSRIDRGQSEISIEYLYSDDEIHTTLGNGCKLFFGDEFSGTSGRHIHDKDLILKNQSDRGKTKVVENNGGQAVYNIEENNILAKKSDFADAVKNNQIHISQDSWDNFKHIFDKIETILNL